MNNRIERIIGNPKANRILNPVEKVSTAGAFGLYGLAGINSESMTEDQLRGALVAVAVTFLVAGVSGLLRLEHKKYSEKLRLQE